METQQINIDEKTLSKLNNEQKVFLASSPFVSLETLELLKQQQRPLHLPRWVNDNIISRNTGLPFMSTFSEFVPSKTEDLLTHKDWTIRKAMATRTDIPFDTIRPLIHDKEPEVLRAVFANPNYPVDKFWKDLEELSNKGFNEEYTKNLKLSIVLKALATNPNFAISQMSCKEKTLPHMDFFFIEKPKNKTEEFVSDKLRKFNVTSAIAKNPSCPSEVLRVITQSSFYPPICSALSNPNCPTDLLEKYSRDESEKIVLAVASNPNAPAEILSSIYKNVGHNLDFANTLSSNPNTPQSVLERCFEDNSRNYYTLCCLASNTNSGKELIEKVFERSLRLSYDNVQVPFSGTSHLTAGKDQLFSILMKNPNLPLVSKEKILKISESMNLGVPCDLARHCSFEETDKIVKNFISLALKQDNIKSEVSKKAKQNKEAIYCSTVPFGKKTKKGLGL